MTSLTISNVRPWGGSAVDIVVENGRISTILEHTGVHPTLDTIDGRGLLALPGFINAHAHIDKSWWGQPWIPFGGEDTVQGRIAHERVERAAHHIPSIDAITAVLREFLRHGTTATRTHVDVDLGIGLRAIDAVREATARLDGAVEVEIVAFPQDGVVRRPGVLELLDAAAQAGASSIGGLDPAAIDRDPVLQLEGLFAIAERRGVGLDIHLHSGGELGAFEFELIVDRTIRAGLEGKVTLSHGFALGELEGARQIDMLDALAHAGISWTTVALPRTAALPWRQMADRKINLGLGTDGIRDLWSPFGDGDMLVVALNFARLHGLRTDDELAHAVHLASDEAAPFVHRQQNALVAGARADIVLIDAENVQDALVRAPQRQYVIAGGRVVVRDAELAL